MLDTVRSTVGKIVFGTLLLPPEPGSPRVKMFEGDYGNGFLYEELFAGNGMDLVAAKKICQQCDGEVLDAGGGAGRLAAYLAEQGVRVTLVDKSKYMLSQAEKKRERLLPLAKENFSIIPTELSSCDLKKKFDVIFAVNSVFEHFSDKTETLQALKVMRAHLMRAGKFYLDVHHIPSLEKDEKWKTGKWRYNYDRKIQGVRFRVWQRTLSGERPEKVICEQAFSTNLSDFTISRTVITVLSRDEWMDLFRRAGFEVFNVWGNWAMDPVSLKLPKMVIKLGLHHQTVGTTW